MFTIPSDINLDRAIIEKAPDSLYRFIKLAWPQVETATYVDNWHIPIVCKYLEAVSKGEIKRLVINQPPGTMKSLTTSVMWPVWHWIKLDPTCKWMFASYDASLVGMVQGGKIIDLMQSEWFINRWGEMLKDKAPGVSMFYTIDGGFRFATSPGGKGTGRHVHIQVMDDLVKPQDAQGTVSVTKKALAKPVHWMKGTASTRSIDAATFSRVLVMQRVHEDDPAGEVLRESGWTHLNLPMRYEKKVTCICENPYCTPEDPRTEEGQLLWPERFPEEVVKYQEDLGMGPIVAAAQYQQRPSPAAGGIYKSDWFRYWHHDAGVLAPQDTKFPCRDKYCKLLPDLSSGILYQSWDLAFKNTDGTDFVAGGVWLFKYPLAFLIDCIWDRLSFVDTIQAILDINKKYPRAITKFIEDKANGPAVMNVLEDSISGIVPVDPAGGKTARANATSGFFKAGNIYIPHPSLAPWVKEYRHHLVGFPKAAFDDMVDMTSQVLLNFKSVYNLESAMQVIMGR